MFDVSVCLVFLWEESGVPEVDLVTTISLEDGVFLTLGIGVRVKCFTSAPPTTLSKHAYSYFYFR